MPTRKLRHTKIIEIVKKREVGSQEALSTALRQAGIRVTQSTLSRDIHELGLVKVRGIYHEAPDAGTVPQDSTVRRSFQQLVVSAHVSGNILLVRTAPGDAHSLGVRLDAADWPEILGTVAGDDTVFALLRNGKLGKKVLKRIQGYLK
jgi:transcriptional regulator of arginine metabolism